MRITLQSGMELVCQLSAVSLTRNKDSDDFSVWVNGVGLGMIDADRGEVLAALIKASEPVLDKRRFVIPDGINISKYGLIGDWI